MRQPASLSKAFPRQDHQEYGPATSPACRRWTSTQAPSANQLSRTARSSGRKPALARLPFQFLRSASRWATLRSPVTRTRSPAAAARRIRCVIASRNAILTSCRSVPASPVWTYAETTVSGPAAVSRSASTQRPSSANAPSMPIRTAVCGSRVTTATPARPLAVPSVCATDQCARPASDSTLPSSRSLARTSCRQSTSGAACCSHGTIPRRAAARIPLTLAVTTRMGRLCRTGRRRRERPSGSGDQPRWYAVGCLECDVPTDALALAPVLLAVVLVVSAVGKLRSPSASAEAFRDLRVPAQLSGTLVVEALPWVELLLAVALVLAEPLVGAVVAVGALLLFTAYLLLVVRALGFDEDVDCACFGAFAPGRITGRTVVRNAWLVGLSVAALGVSLQGSWVAARVADGRLPWWWIAGAMAAAVTTWLVTGAAPTATRQV